MAWEWLFKGVLLGLAIAAPLGPIGIYCIQKTLSSGFKSGLFSGLGAATADAVYGSVAGLGLSSFISYLMGYKALFQGLGGLFICYLGIKFFINTPQVHLQKQPVPKSTLNSYTVTFLLTLSNPMTIVSFLGIFSVSGIVSSSASGKGIPLLICGIFLGSVLWWLLLVSAVSFFHAKILNAPRLSIFNKLSGLVMLGFGVSALIQLIVGS
ncbi:LysE family translocator [Paenibacillus oralis]|uniref:LysE family translocator n=1 Tax=Paenibacillus oralis TaxID=2490856 RepID=A0A3P3UA10_9BACL|nr:LysE family transporter [Paenibacillus oralis]RRJ66984.1 LysE family translocator [Paenibacillus oralis]